MTRKARGHTAEEYTRLWTRNIRLARDAGIPIGVISIPNKETLRAGGVKVGPIDELFNHFMGRMASLPCIWQQNCTDNFVSIDARGHVAQCDCWVTSYPEYRFGNVLCAKSFSQLMKESKARRRFVDRPETMIEHETCAACDYLSLCHGGCPVRAYSQTGEFFVKDPYCEVYKALFSRVEKLATELSRARFGRSLPVLQTRGGSVNREITL